MIVLDASAVLAVLRDEPGADQLREAAAHGAALSTANYSEVLQKVRQHGGNLDDAAGLVGAICSLEPVTAEDAIRAARLWTKGSGPSLGDRLCLALSHRLGVDAWTTDTEWADQAGARVIQR